MENKLKVLVIGGNKGIGYEILKHFISMYPKPISDLLFTVRSKPKGETTVETLSKYISETKSIQTSAKLKYYIMDVTKPDQIQQVSEALVKDGHKINLFVNNAGIFIRGDSKLLPVITETINVNFLGPKNIFETFMQNKNFAENCHVTLVSSGLGMVSRVARHAEVHSQLLGYESPDFSEEMLTGCVNRYLTEVKDRKLSALWPNSCYAVSKMFLSVYASVLSRKYQKMHFLSQCPGWCITDMTKGTNAPRSAAQGGHDIVKSISDYGDQKFTGRFILAGKQWDIKENKQI